MMAAGLLHSALVGECRQAVFPAEGCVVGLAGAAAALLAAFALGAWCVIACVGAADAAVASQWWSGWAAEPDASGPDWGGEEAAGRPWLG